MNSSSASSRNGGIKHKWTSAFRVMQSLHRLKHPPQYATTEVRKKKFIYFIALLLMSRRASLPFTPAPTENLPSDNDSMVPQLHHYYSSHPQLPQINGISRSLFPYYSFERKSSPLAQSILSKRHPANRAFIGLQWTPSSPTLNNCGFYPIAQRFISLPVRCSYVTNRYYHDNPQILPPKKYNFRRSAKSDLAHRFQKNSDYSNESTPSRDIETVDPVYLALKQATGKYGRRSSNYDSTTPSPRNLSEGSLQDSGYAEANYGPNLLDNSSSPVDQPASAHNRRRPPKLHKQMKSISLDCAELPQPIPNNMNSGRTSNRSGMKPATPMKLNNSSGDIPNFDNNQCPSISSPRAPRRIHSSNALQGSHIVIHEYTTNPEFKLNLGERIKIVDNGDPDWLYGFKLGERSDRLISFPSTCVALIQPSEQPMILKQSVHIPEAKIRLYRDQVVFAQPDSLVNGRLLVRTERNAFVECQLQYLSLL